MWSLEGSSIMSKHTEELQLLGEFKLNEWLAVGIKLGGKEQVSKLLACDKVTLEFEAATASVKVKVTRPVRKFLGSSRQVDLPARTMPFDATTFYKTRAGLYIWDDFVSRIVSAAQPVESLNQASLYSFDLARDATDKQIRAELPAEHVFEDTGLFCTNLAGMIERQPDSIAGDLINNGYSNIFYVRGKSGVVFAVRVYWFADDWRWFVCADALGGGRWVAGYRVFSPAFAKATAGKRTAVA
jgi:hypothetical protein